MFQVSSTQDNVEGKPGNMSFGLNIKKNEIGIAFQKFRSFFGLDSIPIADSLSRCHLVSFNCQTYPLLAQSDFQVRLCADRPPCWHHQIRCLWKNLALEFCCCKNSNGQMAKPSIASNSKTTKRIHTYSIYRPVRSLKP